MRKLIEQCPACTGELVVTQQTCVTCGTAVSGQFRPTIFSKLSDDSLAFIEVFVKNKGNVKEMERELGWSYWTIRNRLNEVIEELGFESQPAKAPDRGTERQAVLAQLNRGEIDANAAAELLKQLR